MSQRRFLSALLVLTAAGVGAVAACSDYVPPDVPNYGPPNALGSKTPPAPSGTAAPQDSGSSSGGDAGAPAPGPSYLCVTNGGTLVPAGTCAVSWKNDIYPKIAAGGSWGCAGAGCHVTVPPVLTGDSHTVYAAMANYADGRNNNVPYINPCSTATDPTASSFLCDTYPTNACGDQMPLGAGLPDSGVIAAWTACGAPEN